MLGNRGQRVTRLDGVILDLTRLRRGLYPIGGYILNPLNITRHQDRFFHGFRSDGITRKLNLAVFEFHIQILDTGIGRFNFRLDFRGWVLLVRAEQLFTLVDDKVEKSHCNLL